MHFFSLILYLYKMMSVHLTYFNDSFMMYGNPLQYSCLENPMDGEAWWATVHGLQTVGHD